MPRSWSVVLLSTLLPPLCAPPTYAQGLHVDPAVRDCSIRLAPALTQRDFRTFIGEGAEVGTFRAFSGAAPLGRGHFVVGILYFRSQLDDLKPAWNETFVHPDATHYLGNLTGPVVYGVVGLTDRLDMAAYFTTNPMANYGFLGGSLRYGVLPESATRPAVSLTGNYSTLLRADDVRLHTFAVDLTASKRIGKLVPYLGARGTLSRGSERSPVVNLAAVSMPGAEGFAGLGFSVAFLDLTAETTVGRLLRFNVKVGVRR